MTTKQDKAKNASRPLTLCGFKFKSLASACQALDIFPQRFTEWQKDHPDAAGSDDELFTEFIRDRDSAVLGLLELRRFRLMSMQGKQRLITEAVKSKRFNNLDLLLDSPVTIDTGPFEFPTFRALFSTLSKVDMGEFLYVWSKSPSDVDIRYILNLLEKDAFLTDEIE
jgi:hypothetical protein